MICDLESVEAPGRLYRLGRHEAVWAWPNWAFAGKDGTFGNRYDDSKGQYRVLYASYPPEPSDDAFAVIAGGYSYPPGEPAVPVFVCYRLKVAWTAA